MEGAGAGYRKVVSMSRHVVLLCGVPLLLAAQTGELASISGQVTDAVTGEPIRKATLMLRCTQAQPGPSGARPLAIGTTSDAAGQFSLRDLEPGSCRLNAERNGFVSSEYGARKPGRRGTMLVLTPGQSMTQLAVRLWPQGVITGRVVDEDGDPVRGAAVQVVRFRYNGPKKQLMTASGANTNDLGEYRIFDLPPAKYYLSVQYHRGQRGPEIVDRSPDARPDDNYVTTYYPGTHDLAAAAQLDVTAGAQLRNIDVTLTKTHTVRVRGRVVGETGEAGRGLQVTLMSPGGPSQGTATSATGEFEIRGVAPGSYVLMAYSGRGSRISSARRPLEVGTGNIEGLVLTLGQAAPVTGHVRVDGQSTQPPGKVLVRLQPFEPGSFMFGPLPNTAVGPDGSFKLEGAGAGHYSVIVAGLPDGYYVKSISAGNVDVLADGLEMGTSAIPPLEIVVSPNAGEVTGTVQNAVGAGAGAGRDRGADPAGEGAAGEREFLQDHALARVGAVHVP